AVAKYAAPPAHGELYTVVSVDALSKVTQKAPNGFDWSQLIADFDSLGGHISAPTPAAAQKPARAAAPRNANQKTTAAPAPGRAQTYGRAARV
ncbi:MAG TPA: hypothetical protein VG269_25175, partial [Tepidisphaeraceae bacterium]|nr:hypothetical protein [Tepidisphaeraceae bacterium]